MNCDREQLPYIPEDNELARFNLSSWFPGVNSLVLYFQQKLHVKLLGSSKHDQDGSQRKAKCRSTAPIEDGLPIPVWKKIWKYISGIVVKIFTASIHLHTETENQ